MNKIDLHVHTISTGHAMSSLSECVRAAEEKGVVAIAITDHGPNLKGAPQSAYFSVLCNVVPQMLGNIRIFKGIESNILDIDGAIDVPIFGRAGFDLVLAYIHPFTMYRDGGEKANTRAILSAFEKNSCIDILSHPVTSWFPVDVKEIVEKACAHGIAIELNENSLRNKRLDQEKIKIMVETTLKACGKFAISSDAHIADDIGGDSRARGLVQKYNIPEESILNGTLDRVLDFIGSRKGLKK
jgi:putative hydrolase